MPTLKNPLPTNDENIAAIDGVFSGIDKAYPSTGSNAYPQEGDVVDCFAVEGVTVDVIIAANVQVLGYFGAPGSEAQNEATRQAAYVKNHPSISRAIADCITTGAPIPSKESFVPPALVVTFSESQIKARLLETPPRRYDGAPCYDQGLYESTFKADIAVSRLKMAADPAYAGIAPDVLDTLAHSLWGKGQAYHPPNFDAFGASGKTAAEVFYEYDTFNAKHYKGGPTA
jgi:hypothetical protein